MTFLKRDREMKQKQRALDKASRKAARQADGPVGKGPPIDWSSLNDGTADAPSPAPADDDVQPPPADDVSVAVTK
ncbi:MAG: hypothetical protein JNL83_11490 [Myxococcales bacterium]|nr:hypothetical protein [Myxococcales bacterium]